MQKEQLESMWYEHRDGLVRGVGRLAKHIEATVMQRLITLGYPRLAMHYALPLSVLAQENLRPSEMALRMGVSKQHCQQILKPLYEDGYIEQRADKKDARAKLLSLRPLGARMVRDAIEELLAIHNALGEPADELGKLIAKCLGIDHYHAQENRMLTTTISLFSRRLQQQMLAHCQGRGFKGLQPSFMHIVLNVDIHGTTVSDLARLNDISGQAVSRVVRELQELDYVRSETDQRDKRSRRIHLSKQGFELLQVWVESQSVIEQRLASNLGHGAQVLVRYVQQLNEQLSLPNALSVFDLSAPISLGHEEDGRNRFGLEHALLAFALQSQTDSVVEQVSSASDVYRFTPEFQKRLAIALFSKADLALIETPFSLDTPSQ